MLARLTMLLLFGIPDFIVKNLFGFRSATENFSNKKFVYHSQLFLMLTKSASQTADP